MKRIFIMLLAFISMKATAQNYKPLDPVEVPNTYSTVIKVEEKQLPHGDTYYCSSHCLALRGFDAYMGVPFTYDVYLKTDGISIPENITAKFFIGGEEYSFRYYYVSNENIYIDIQGSHIKHVAVSGIQKIFFHNCGDEIHTIEFNLVEQELWRRTAEELIKAIDKYKVL